MKKGSDADFERAATIIANHMLAECRTRCGRDPVRLAHLLNEQADVLLRSARMLEIGAVFAIAEIRKMRKGAA